MAKIRPTFKMAGSGCTTVTSKFGERNAPTEGASKDHKGIENQLPGWYAGIFNIFVRFVV